MRILLKYKIKCSKIQNYWPISIQDIIILSVILPMKLICRSFVAADPTNFLPSASPVVVIINNNKMANCKNMAKIIQLLQITGVRWKTCRPLSRLHKVVMV